MGSAVFIVVLHSTVTQNTFIPNHLLFRLPILGFTNRAQLHPLGLLCVPVHLHETPKQCKISSQTLLVYLKDHIISHNDGISHCTWLWDCRGPS